MATIRQIQYFSEVAEEGSLRKAAERMGVSQPTLSVQITALEKDLGLTLFERSRTSTRLTPSGRELLPVARDLLRQHHDFEELAHSLSNDASTTHRVGVPPTLGPYLLPAIVPTLHERYSRLKLYVREDTPQELETGLLQNRYDFLLTPLPLRSPYLVQEVLFREPLWLVAPREMRLVEGKELSEKDLAGRKILALDGRHLLHRQVEDICEKTGAELNRNYEGTSLDNLRQMVVMGMGLAFLPALYVRSEIHRPEELQIFKIQSAKLFREHALVYRPNSPSRHLYRSVADLIRELAGKNLTDAVIPIYDRS